MERIFSILYILRNLLHQFIFHLSFVSARRNLTMIALLLLLLLSLLLLLLLLLFEMHRPWYNTTYFPFLAYFPIFKKTE
jgi:hypothetical protein